MYKRILLFCVLTLSISSCISSKPDATPIISPDGECLPSLYDVAYPVITPESYTSPTSIPPQGNWEIQGALPFKAYRSIILSRQNQREFWFPYGEKIYKYSIDNKTWKSYETTNLAKFNLSDADNIRTMFVASDGTLWGSVRYSHLSEDNNYPLLVRFNDSTDQFEFIPDNGGLLNLSQVHGIETDIVEDQSGRLWFFTSDSNFTTDVLYSFDVNTREAQVHYSYDYSTGSGSPLAIGPDGNVWFIEVFKHRLVRYDPATGDVRFYAGYPETTTEPSGSFFLFDVSKVVNLYFDRSGNLWLDSYGWLDFSNDDAPVWHQVITSPAFIFEFPSEEKGRYHAVYPQNPYQSSNGWYWFTDSSGIIRLDLQKGEWCVVSRGEGSNIVEDADHNLWVAVSGHLYKYDLQAK
jgi:hypothetical protein